MTYPYMLKTATLREFLEKIPVVGVPDKITIAHLYALGFRSVNDRPLIPVLKFIKFIDSSGIPTEKYKQYRNKSISTKILGQAVQEAYQEVFKMYPDAHQQSNETLRNFFSTHTTLGERALKSVVETFKGLCNLSDFGTTTKIEPTANINQLNEDIAPSTQINENKIDLSLGGNRRARILVPEDITSEEIEKLKKMLDLLK